MTTAHSRLLMLVSLLALIAFLLLAGCAGLSLQAMSPEQLKATQGMATCTLYSGMYGQARVVTINADAVRKGDTSISKAVIANDCSTTIETNVGVAPTTPAKASP